MNINLKSIFLLATFLFISSNLFAQGVCIAGVGSVNRSMSGVGVATAMDPIGSVHWNSGAITEFEQNEAQASLEVVWMNTKLSSSLPTGAAGEEESTNSERYVPSLGIVWKPDNSRFSFGLGAYGIAGFAADYRTSTTSPISAPPSFGGLGQIVGNAKIFQFAPTVAYKVSDSFSVGMAPTLSLAKVRVNPMLFGPVQSDFTYTTDVEESDTYGGGFQVGALWKANEEVNVGASYKSTQWFEDFEYTSRTTSGGTRNDSLDIEYPQIISAGVSYTGLRNLTLAADLRYFMYGSAKGFEESGFDVDGSVKGLGWDDVFVVAVGGEYKLNEKLALRAGYSYNENPISSDVLIFNVATPLIQQHVISMGAGYELKENLTVSISTSYVPSSDITGQLQTPAGAIPGSQLKSEVDYAISVATGIQYRF